MHAYYNNATWLATVKDYLTVMKELIKYLSMFTLCLYDLHYKLLAITITIDLYS